MSRMRARMALASDSLRLLIGALFLVPAGADCLTAFPDTYVPAAERKNVTIEGVSMPLGIISGNWDSARVIRDIMLIVGNEVLGYNTVRSRETSSSVDGYASVTGCQDPFGATTEDMRCAVTGYAYQDHINMEIWGAVADSTISALESCCPAIAPAQGRVLSYRGVENEYVYPHSFVPAAQNFISLTYYKSWNASWTDPSPYFSKLSDFQAQEIMLCSANANLNRASVISNFLRATSFQAAIVNNQFDCWNDKWVLGPACRVAGFDPANCVPYITAFGWQMESAIQKIFAFNTAMAYGEAIDWPTYVYVPRTYRVASYWWTPAQEFADIGPQVITWVTPSNKAAWDSGIRTAINPGSDMQSYVSPIIREQYDRIFRTVKNLNLNLGDVTNQMQDLQMILRTGAAEPHYDTACGWIQANLAKVKAWLPSPVECAAGTGVRTATGGFDPATLEDAAYCEWCPPGRFSDPIQLVGDNNANVQSFKCTECPAGQKIAIGGSTACESCSVGSFSSSPGQTSCSLCSIGSYQGERGASTCRRCPGPMVTAQEGSLLQTECVCPEKMVRPCRLRSAPGGLREGCRCDLGVYYQATSEVCVACPSTDFLQCPMGTDEVDLPCTAGMENASLNYPRPVPGYYTSFDEPMKVFKCKDTLICPGNAVGLCGPNAYGIACGLCEEGYFRNVDGYCEQCSGLFRVPFIPLLALFAVPIGLIVMIKIGGKNDVTKGKVSVFNELLGVSYVGIIFMQTLGTNIGIMPSAPSVIADSFSWTPAISDIASQFRLSCFTTMSFEVEFALKLLAPIYLAGLFFCVYLLALCVPRINLNKDVVIGTYLSFFNAFFISVMNLSLTLFQTYRNPSGDWSMISAPSVLTSSSIWQNMVYGTGLAVFIYGVGAAAGSTYAIIVAPGKFKDIGFRQRWKCLFLQVRPSVYWWVIVSIIKGLFLSLTTVIFDSPMAQTVWLGTGLLFYFLAVFWFLPWRTSTLLCLDVALHYVLAVLCLLMPFFVPAAATELTDVAVLFMIVSFFGAVIACGCILGIMRTQAPNAQRAWRLTYERDARNFVKVFEVMNDEKVMYDVLQGLGDVDFATSVAIMKLLSVELLGNRETGRLIWRKHGRLGFNKKEERGPDLPEHF